MSRGDEEKSQAESPPGGRPVTYCILPRDLAPKLHDTLRSHFRDVPDLEVIVERREQERRILGDRRVQREQLPPTRDAERRAIRARAGRRVGERRRKLVPVETPALPRRARAYAERIAFVVRLEPTTERLEDLDTARVVARVQAGDRDAYSIIFSRYFDRVYGYLRVALKDHHEAEDATQEVFADVLASLPSYERREQPFRAWLFSIVRNRAVDSLRRSGRLEVTDPEELDRVRESQDPDQDEAIAWVVDWISDPDLQFLFERLPAAQRQVLMMRFVDGMSHAKIAKVLNRSDKSVRMLQHRALKYLNERLTALGRAPRRTERAKAAGLARRNPVTYSRRFSLTDNGPMR